MKPSAVIFDLDGTLTEPLLDFDLIRREAGLPAGLPILEQLVQLSTPEREQAQAIVQRHENDAIERAVLADGCIELLAHLRERGVPSAILTRNTRVAVDRFCALFALTFRGCYTRDDGPPKPSPAGVLRLCADLQVLPAQTLVVGDYKFDILAGRDAGARTALVAGEPPADLSAWGPPDLVVPSLRALIRLWPS